MPISIIIAILCVIVAYMAFLVMRPKDVRICFVGPHSTGKTVSLLSLLGLDNKTVTTLASHRVIYKNKEIFELVPDESNRDFVDKYQLNPNDKFVFFVKNEEEIDSFPDCSGFDIVFVMWKKTKDKKRKDLIYLDESREKLKDLILKM
ncbi:uncharacterized protein VICG_00868 [Vittaforma corneae ATCC 50505]|uniref:Signal recognition particle receptor subunit beta n=1 Tax=Vittaforma corneae (strain ATCC 50505) TaxID=993615 RepID=L2GMF0_VITCO|nr:uncharacterized protein VICG_00868 [Vittaforma corneae ATCC 50505]ELA42021.1 hypothetical protein VICG_00868 [Vittaforma corneae ATCC 50505]